MSETGFKCKLRVILAEREIKHGVFAKRIGMSEASFSSIVNNKSLPQFPYAYAILDELQLQIHEVWMRIEK